MWQPSSGVFFCSSKKDRQLKRVDEFLKKPMRAANDFRRERAKTLLPLDDEIVKRGEALKAKGRTSPYPQEPSSLFIT